MSSSDGDADSETSASTISSDDSWVPGPPDPNSPEQLRLTRIDNARLITSNTIPQMDHANQMPYCVWYPGFATKETYRALAQRYPALRYNVGRACAVGGFLDLYLELELDLLPDVSIAEEAREAGEINSSEGSTAIFRHIMSQPVRFRVMDDYTRTVNLENREAACLNGDTALRPPLAVDGGWIWEEYFDITEDNPAPHEERSWNDGYCWEDNNLPRRFAYLFHSPLPRDLPTARKNHLLVMAAYEGNLDRYARLRRAGTVLVRGEAEAVIHGIYHSTTFAKYWSLQEKPDFRFHLAITARFIMVNDLSHLPEKPDPDDHGEPHDLPHVIWYPLLPREETLRELVRRLPNQRYLLESVALACVAADYHGTYDLLGIRPNLRLWQQAQKSPNRHYVEDLRRRAAELGTDEELPDWYCNWYELQALDIFPTTGLVIPIEDWATILDDVMETCGTEERWMVEANSAKWELYIASSDEVRDRAEGEWAGGGAECLDLYEGLIVPSKWVATLPERYRKVAVRLGWIKEVAEKVEDEKEQNVQVTKKVTEEKVTEGKVKDDCEQSAP